MSHLGGPNEQLAPMKNVLGSGGGRGKLNWIPDYPLIYNEPFSIKLKLFLPHRVENHCINQDETRTLHYPTYLFGLNC